MDHPDLALRVNALAKTYDDGTVALESLDLEVPAGEFFGLLGTSRSNDSRSG